MSRAASRSARSKTTQSAGAPAARTTLRTAKALNDAGLLPDTALPAAEQVARRYAIAVPPHLAKTLAGRSAEDALHRQFIPSAEELVVAREELGDPIGDDTHSAVKGIVHRYQDR